MILTLITFLAFLHNLPFYGLAVLCIDDPVIKAMLPDISRPILTYGFSEDADYRIQNMSVNQQYSYFDLHRPNGAGPLSVEMNIPGAHNILNAAAAITVAIDEGVSFLQAEDGIRDVRT